MTQEKIKEGNELIARFMSMNRGHPNAEERRWKEAWFESLDPTGHIFESGLRHTYLHFNHDWNWLMPVVDKISEIFNQADEELYNKITTTIGVYELFDLKMCGPRIEHVWELVVSFIKWYNKNGTSQSQEPIS